MSYCRLNERDSDVYVYGSTKFECTVAWQVAHDLEISQYFSIPWDKDDGTAQKTMYGHLVYLRDIGVRVPERTFRRLMNEITELAPIEDYDDQ